jgi:hypothetical protein
VAITVAWYGLGLMYLLDQPLDLETATCQLSLHTSSYTPDRDNHDFFDDVSASEVATGSGYTTLGVTLTGVTWGYDSASDQVRLDFVDPGWTFTGSKTWLYGVLWVNTAGAPSTDPLIALLTWDSAQTVSTAYNLTIDPAGLLYLDTT